MLGLLLTIDLGAQPGVFGSELTDFGGHLLQFLLHLVCLDLLAVTGVLGGFAVLHFPPVHLLFLCQMVEAFASALRLLLWMVEVEQVAVDDILCLWRRILNRTDGIIGVQLQPLT